MKYCEMCMTVPASIINLKLHLIIQIVHISKKNQEYSLFFKLLNCQIVYGLSRDPLRVMMSLLCFFFVFFAV